MLLLAMSAGMPDSCAVPTACAANAADSNLAKPPPILGLGLNMTKPGMPAKKVWSVASSIPASVAPTEATVSTCAGFSGIRARLPPARASTGGYEGWYEGGAG